MATIQEVEAAIRMAGDTATQEMRSNSANCRTAYHVGRLEGIALGLLWAQGLPTKEILDAVRQERSKDGKFKPARKKR